MVTSSLKNLYLICSCDKVTVFCEGLGIDAANAADVQLSIMHRHSRVDNRECKNFCV